MSMMARAQVFVAAFILTVPLVAGAKDALEQTRAEFRAAYDVALQGPVTDTVADSETLRAYPLYPYLQAARIERRFEQSSTVRPEADAQAAAFLAQFTDEPIARSLRRDWLTSLAERQRWADFVAAYQPQVATATLRCQHLA